LRALAKRRAAVTKMRSEFAQAILTLAAARRDLVFLTADLGYMALEKVAEALGERFINTGVAEQNAISLAAGLASEGQLPFFYSMAAFTTLRPIAQIRDNVCLHNLPVKLVGNGGGYGYGMMGPTHHALEDLAVMRALPNMTIYIPLVAGDVVEVVGEMAQNRRPNYLRLNRAALIPGVVPRFSGWRKLKSGDGAVVIATGPVVESLFGPDLPDPLRSLEIWSIGKLPLESLPAELALRLDRRPIVFTLEEHYLAGGLGEAVAHLLLTQGKAPTSFHSICAAGYPSGRYGSQEWHQAESGLKGPGLFARLTEAIRG
jgi:transketolase